MTTSVKIAKEMTTSVKRIKETTSVKKNEISVPILTKSEPSLALEPKVRPKNHYFDNDLVQEILKRYVARGCVDIELRDEIMHHAEELIRQVIRAHNFEHIFPNRDSSSALELFQVAYVQIEKVLYKYDPQPGSPKLFNLWCINNDSLIFSEDGIKSIKDVINDKNNKTYGLDKICNIKNNITKDTVDTLKITTGHDYNIECTPDHYLYKLGNNGPEWIKSKNLKIGDLLGIQYNQNNFIGDDKLDISLDEEGDWIEPLFINEELAYIIGLYISEGSYYKNTLTIYNIDKEVISSLLNNKLGLRCFHKPKYQRINIYNKKLIELIKKLGLEDKHSTEKIIPQKLLKCSKKIIISLLRGMFDGDGHSSRHNGCVGYTSTSLKLINQLRMLMLNFGIITKLSTDNRKTRNFKINGKKEYNSKLSGAYQILLSAFDSLKFYNDIGFNVLRKQLNISNLGNIRILRHGLLDKVNTLCNRYDISNRLSGLRSARKSISGACEILKVGEKLADFEMPDNDKDKQFIIDRLAEFMNRHDNIIWFPINKIEKSSSKVSEIEVDSESSSYIANGFISHNSQVSKTRILAYLKKEKRDKKNVVSYKDFLSRKQKIKLKNSTDIDLWLKEVREMLEYNEDFLKIADAIEKIWYSDEKSHDGLISKIEKISGKNRNIISQFFKTIRLRRDEFTVNLLEVKDPKDIDASDTEDFFYIDQDQ
jgi:hypothetical protein